MSGVLVAVHDFLVAVTSGVASLSAGAFAAAVTRAAMADEVDAAGHFVDRPHCRC